MNKNQGKYLDDDNNNISLGGLFTYFFFLENFDHDTSDSKTVFFFFCRNRDCIKQ